LGVLWVIAYRDKKVVVSLCVFSCAFSYSGLLAKVTFYKKHVVEPPELISTTTAKPETSDYALSKTTEL
jgi:hypothetical protein